MNDKDIVALIPAHDEEPGIVAVVEGLMRQGLAVLVVDDGSTDRTSQAARQAGARVVRLDPNRGKGAALKEGFRMILDAEDSASYTHWKAILTLDGDGQHDPAEAPALIREWRRTGADLVVGARDYHEMPPVRRFTNSVSRAILSRALGQRVPDNQSGYRLRSRRLAEATLSSSESGFAFEVEEIAICAGRGYRISWVPIQTIYGDETSDIRPWSHFAGFMRVVWRARRRVRHERRYGGRGIE